MEPVPSYVRHILTSQSLAVGSSADNLNARGWPDFIRNSFTDELLLKELREKTREWQECLKYTPKFVLSAIKYLANKHVEGVWTQAHKALLDDSV